MVTNKPRSLHKDCNMFAWPRIPQPADQHKPQITSKRESTHVFCIIAHWLWCSDSLSSELDSIIKKPHTMISHHLPTRNRKQHKCHVNQANPTQRLSYYTSAHITYEPDKCIYSFCHQTEMRQITSLASQIFIHGTMLSLLGLRWLPETLIVIVTNQQFLNSSDLRNSHSASHTDSCLITVCETLLE